MRLFIPLLCLLLIGCESTRLDLPNGCVLVAKYKAAQQAKRLLLQAGDKPRILVLKWLSKTPENATGHAVCVWPERRNVMCYDYDRGGSFRLLAGLSAWDEPVTLATAFMGSRWLYDTAFFYDQ